MSTKNECLVLNRRLICINYLDYRLSDPLAVAKKIGETSKLIGFKEMLVMIFFSQNTGSHVIVRILN